MTFVEINFLANDPVREEMPVLKFKTYQVNNRFNPTDGWQE